MLYSAQMLYESSSADGVSLSQIPLKRAVPTLRKGSKKPGEPHGGKAKKNSRNATPDCVMKYLMLSFTRVVFEDCSARGSSHLGMM